MKCPKCKGLKNSEPCPICKDKGKIAPNFGNTEFCGMADLFHSQFFHWILRENMQLPAQERKYFFTWPSEGNELDRSKNLVFAVDYIARTNTHIGTITDFNMSE